MTYELNAATAQRVIDAIRPGLVEGLGKPIPGQMCVEAAVCYAMGLPHSDEPTCVGEAIRGFKISLNDSPNWSSNKARAEGMIRLGVAQLGSDTLDQSEFARRVVDQSIRQILPVTLRAAGLEDAAIRCTLEGSRDAVVSAQDEAHKFRLETIEERERLNCKDNFWEASESVRLRGDAAYRADRCCDYLIDALNMDDGMMCAGACAAASARYSGEVGLNLAADIALQILIDMKSPGCEYLDLIDR